MHRIRLSHPIARAAIAAALMLSVAPLHAQVSDSTVFRAGQWGAEFTVNGNALGLLRFSSPNSAWVGQVQGSWQSSDRDVNAPPSLPSQPSAQETSVRQIEVQFGKRWYRPLAGDVLQHFTFGALASNERQEQAFNNNPGRVQGTNAVGLFADFGAQWMVTKNLSLGAHYGLAARRARTSIDDSDTDITVSTMQITVGPVGIRAALYF